jgi:acyl carrier protein
MTVQRKLTPDERRKIYEEICQYLADELEVDVKEITEDTNIIDDLGGDSILFLEMIEEAKEKYGINLEVRVIGQYMLKNPVYTVGETVNAVCDIIEKGEELIAQLEKEMAMADEKAEPKKGAGQQP